MSEEREPVRLRDDPNEDPRLRELLDAARGEQAPDDMLDRVLADIVASGGGGGGSSGGGAAMAKAVTTTVSVVVGAVVVVLVLGRVLVPDRAQLAHVDAAVIDDAGAPDTGPPDTGPLDAGPSDVGVIDGGPVDAHVRRASLAPPPIAPLPDDGTLLLQATRARASDPARSLALALDHRTRFPQSAASEDREALIVLDLAALGRAPEARAAADAFRARWPRSPHLTRIDPVLARLPPP
jgi:hypothetical protein